MGFLVIVIIAAAAIAIAIYVNLAAKRRVQALAALAASNGLEFNEEDPFNLPDRLAGISQFNQGNSRKASNVIHGTYAGRDVLLFDYQYTTGSGKNRHTHRLSACLEPAGVPLPALLIRPETFLDKAAAFVGFEDIDFESDEFSRKFFVKGPDKKFAYDVCNPQMMSWLLANAGNFSIEIIDSGLVLMNGSTWSPEDFQSALCFSARFWELIPDFVWKQYGAAGAAE